ncbi:MAG: FAD:protein FMN transferase [Clostridia bacterium]|nr:FAD:protein FMN transferase [Clostridia bacterium]
MKKISGKTSFIIFAVLVFLAAAAAGNMIAKKSEKSSECFDYSGEILNTNMDQHIYAEKAQAYIAVMAERTALETEILLSWRTEKSDVLKINGSVDTPVGVSNITLDVIETTLEVAKATGGAFSPTMLPIIKTWGFDSAVQFAPEGEAVKTAVKKSDYRNLSVDMENGTALVRKNQAVVYLEPVIKGAACERVIESYTENGAQGAMVSIGECVGAVGTKGSSGEAWSVDIQDPEKETGTALGTLSFDGGYIATKGVYQTFFVEKDKVYHNIIDPRTGYPAVSNITSVTVLSNSGVVAEAAAYACIVAGKARIPAIAEALGIEVLAVDSEKNIYITPGLENRFSLAAEGYNICLF